MQLDYRYPTEIRTLLVTILVLTVALLLTTPFTVGATLVLFVLGVGLNYLIVRSQIESLKRRAVRVTATQLPEINALVDECARRVGLPAGTEVYVKYSPVMNASAMGVGKPYSIVLNSALVEALGPDELKSVIGHEMGHIKFGHTALLTLVGQLGSQTFGLPLVGDLIRYVFLFWSRAAEFTADRAGLVAVGRLDRAVATEVKLAVGPDLAQRVDLRELARQAREARGSLLGTLGEMESTHPMMTTRIQKMVDFAASETFARLRPDMRAVNFQEADAWQLEQPTLSSGGVCPQCGNPLLKGAAFCMRCGARAHTPRRCLQCHTPLEAAWKICPRCGKAISG